MKLFRARIGSFVPIIRKTIHGYNAFVTGQKLSLSLDVYSTSEHKFDLAKLRDRRARLDLPDAAVYVRQNHGFCFERGHRRIGRAADDGYRPLVECFDRTATGEPPAHRSGAAL